MTTPEFVIEYLDPATLSPHPQNWRQHPEPQKEALAASLSEHQWLAAPIWNRVTGHLLDGHLRVEIAREREEAAIPIRVIDVPEAQEKRILASFDRIGSLAEQDEGRLAELLQELQASEAGLPAGWEAEDLETLLEELGQGAGGLLPDADPDEIPEECETRVKAGELWQLGEHRLGCLDCRDGAALKALLQGDEPAMVFADPPYGINIVQTGGHHAGRPSAHQITERLGTIGGAKPFGKVAGGTAGKTKIIAAGAYPEIIGDESIDTAIDAFRHCESQWPQAVQIWWGANHYAGFLPCSSGWIVWDKENTGSFGDGEMAWTNQKKAVRIFRHMWNGLMKASERGEKRVHPTQKPVALAGWCFEQFGARGDVILDPFLGSGMSIIAAEATGRRVVACELSPDYCDVAIARWEAATGKSAERLA